MKLSGKAATLLAVLAFGSAGLNTLEDDVEVAAIKKRIGNTVEIIKTGTKGGADIAKTGLEETKEVLKSSGVSLTDTPAEDDATSTTSTTVDANGAGPIK
jgi:hypothetical protein